MSNYRRENIKGATYFFTVVTYRRQKILTNPESINILRDVIKKVKGIQPFTIDAWVLLPDHLHAIWTLPSGDNEYSKRWGMIKTEFSKGAKHLFHREEWINESKAKRRESTIWQRRFWEHQIKSDKDF